MQGYNWDKRSVDSTMSKLSYTTVAVVVTQMWSAKITNMRICGLQIQNFYSLIFTVERFFFPLCLFVDVCRPLRKAMLL